MSSRYLLGRYLDPMLGVFTGILAYSLHESNPRSRPEPGHRLQELVAWQWKQSTQSRRSREERYGVFSEQDEAEIERLRRELTGNTMPEKQ
ncbi:hypothetical protein QFC24_005408 [Naganishia onofrii]|uniref:Uncharacterized protein n=1 Tax=Naganishia onofrii TaxID=1851511 RepID=A0ACC2X960_9TREE|nr:hypothetical protein QFC24_005408 [Naganishia onofrii]